MFLFSTADEVATAFFFCAKTFAGDLTAAGGGGTEKVIGAGGKIISGDGETRTVGGGATGGVEIYVV